MLPFTDWDISNTSYPYGPDMYKVIQRHGVEINELGRKKFREEVLDHYDAPYHEYGKSVLMKVFASEFHPCARYYSNNTDITLVKWEHQPTLISSPASIQGAYHNPYD